MTANIITGVRIACSIALLFFPAFSPAFYALYVAAGVSDMIDGAVARKTKTAGAFGSKLDTAADLALVAACLIKLIPAVHMPVWLIVWIIVIALIKAVNVISGCVMRREIVVLHTVMNKVTGMVLFILPLTLTLVDIRYSGSVAAAVATFAAIQEGHLIRTGAWKSDQAGEKGPPQTGEN
ncbi:MAG: CDP-alcohol phosphatidyltransferase family protein [Oscillospiraceae bacterium]|nr:CDP-alcohol phosphatidyltransferase family protein [Oscillospiraceae bacterium]